MLDKKTQAVIEKHNNRPTTIRDIRVAHWVQRLAIIMFVGMAIVIAILYYWAVFPQRVVEVRNQPMPVRPNPVAQQSVIFVHSDYCFLAKANMVVRTSLVSDKTEIFQPADHFKANKGCRSIDAPILLPAAATPGIYRVHYRLMSQVNPLRTLTEDFYSREFIIQ